MVECYGFTDGAASHFPCRCFASVDWNGGGGLTTGVAEKAAVEGTSVALPAFEEGRPFMKTR